MDTTGFGFPFRINDLGQVSTTTSDDNIRGKIVQIVLTAPGERVGLPEFGCGLRDLVFDPNNEILAATSEFAITRALQQWLGDEIILERVDVSNPDERLQVQVVYLRRDRLEREIVKIAF
jgi:phage baseplate assembly protein W